MEWIENIYKSAEEQRQAAFMECFAEFLELQNER